MPTQCPNCKALNTDTARFCKECGAALTILPDQEKEVDVAGSEEPGTASTLPGRAGSFWSTRWGTAAKVVLAMIAIGGSWFLGLIVGYYIGDVILHRFSDYYTSTDMLPAVLVFVVSLGAAYILTRVSHKPWVWFVVLSTVAMIVGTVLAPDPGLWVVGLLVLAGLVLFLWKYPSGN
jgi:hypothetical protein